MTDINEVVTMHRYAILDGSGKNRGTVTARTMREAELFLGFSERRRTLNWRVVDRGPVSDKIGINTPDGLKDKPVVFKDGDCVVRSGIPAFVPIGTKGRVAHVLRAGHVIVDWDWRNERGCYSASEAAEMLSHDTEQPKILLDTRDTEIVELKKKLAYVTADCDKLRSANQLLNMTLDRRDKTIEELRRAEGLLRASRDEWRAEACNKNHAANASSINMRMMEVEARAKRQLTKEELLRFTVVREDGRITAHCEGVSLPVVGPAVYERIAQLMMMQAGSMMTYI